MLGLGGLALIACSGGADAPPGSSIGGSTTGGSSGGGTGGITLGPLGGTGGVEATGGVAGSVEFVCGDGVLDEGETCDDANARPGDGCSGRCEIEPGYECPEPGAACSAIVVCGDGVVGGVEICDDGNTVGGDGCVAGCSSIDPGYSCPLTGGPCTASVDACGNGVVDTDEECDDGGAVAGDGCSADCRAEPGFICPREGGPCQPSEVCGDGLISYTRNETCDDANTTVGDGCSDTCRIEAGWACTTTAPSTCTYDVVCGDRRLRGNETCDDGNDVSGDGCSADCQVETGHTCPNLGAPCRPLCGDGVVLGRETCDDGNVSSGDGCSPTCQYEPGWVCTGSSCRRTVCGDGVREGYEACDDGNGVPFDGCSSECITEPRCGTASSPVGACTSVCGDGILLRGTGEVCDDGNTVSGDGCSANCRTVEPGYVCTSAYDVPPSTLTLPIIYRDFANSHPDFGDFCCGEQTGIVQSLLGADRKPVYAGTDAAPIARTSGKTAFDQWYRDVAGTNITFYETLTLARQATGGVYSMNSDTDAPWFDRCGFYPLEDVPRIENGQPVTYQITWDDDNNSSTPPVQRTCLSGDGWGFGEEWLSHNYLFTSELRYWFEYQGGERLDFSGDDDVWVFVNGRLAVDLGGVHGRLTGSVTLTLGADGQTNATYQLTRGNVYEVALFQAERWCCESNYWLTLSNFAAGRSTCGPNCGDGIVTGDEACDLGTAQNTGAHGGCMSDCTLAPFCGDGITNGDEECDDGSNSVPYDSSGQACAPACVHAHTCGDGAVDSAYGEECDLGADNAAGAYGPGACTDTCHFGAFCGDGYQNGTEECDDGSANGTVRSPCDTECRIRCGNGVREAGEECDLGVANNTGEYGGCTSSCTLGPHCGDGTRNGLETCDDGTNDGSYGRCLPDCTVGEYCGDGIVNGPETCDEGDANVTDPAAYGPDLCTTQCAAAPYCGDGIVQPPEQCDGDSSCTPQCVLKPPE
jgi:fibro-slime domain-containing protein